MVLRLEQSLAYHDLLSDTNFTHLKIEASLQSKDSKIKDELWTDTHENNWHLEI